MKNKLQFLFATILLFNLAKAQNISTIAGGGPPSGSIATNIAIYPASVTTDALGNNIYFIFKNQVFKETNGTITLFAGDGTTSYGTNGDGGQAILAQLNQPSNVTLDRKGNLFIADQGDNKIRKVDVSTGIITTIAGTIYGNHNGDGGLATSASLARPYDMAIDTIGNVYISEQGYNCIRKISASTGIITTIAGLTTGISGYGGDGGLATAAQFAGVYGIAVDMKGNVFITDGNNQRIRRVDGNTGIIMTIAGNGVYGFSGDGGVATAAQLGGPLDVDVDTAGNVYIVDQTNSRIRKITAITGVISTIVGNGFSGYNGDGGLAITSSLYYPIGIALDAQNNIYIADIYNNRVRKVFANNNTITTISGNGTYSYSGDNSLATSAQLANPIGVALDALGNVYIGDAFNNRIRKVSVNSGNISTIAGNGTAGFNGDGGFAANAQLNGSLAIVIDKNGNIYLSDNNRIRKITAASGIITTIGGNGSYGNSGDGGLAVNASLYYPQGLALDLLGNIYFADQSNNRIRKIDAITGIITTIAGNGTLGTSGDGGLATAAQLYYPTNITVDALNNVYICDELSNRIRKVDALSGIITTIAGNGNGGYNGDGIPAISAQLYNPGFMAFDRQGNLYVADGNNNRIRRIDKNTSYISTIEGNGQSGFGGDGGLPINAKTAGVAGLAIDSIGNVYFADYSNSRIRKVTLNSSVLPITLLNFTLERLQNTAYLHWETSTEERSAFFNIQRSTDGLNFETIGKVGAAGSIVTQQYYNYIDPLLILTSGSTIFYRLQLVDIGGAFTYSAIKTINLNAIGEISKINIWPNPAKNYVSLTVDGGFFLGSEAIMADAIGHQIKIVKIKTNETNISLSDLSTGIYFLTFKNGKTLKFIKE